MMNIFVVAGVEIDDCIMIEDDDMLFLSNGDGFIAPTIEAGASYRVQNGLEREKLPAVVGGYKVGKLLGRGGFGEVRVGEHQLTGERVALKFLRKADILSIGAAERTITEIQCLTALQHQNIIRLQQVLLFIAKLILFYRIACILYSEAFGVSTTCGASLRADGGRRSQGFPPCTGSNTRGSSAHRRRG
jgi:hypothetical protein